MTRKQLDGVIDSESHLAPANPPRLTEWFQWHHDPTMLSLVRICAQLPPETRSVLEQYLSGCFLDAVAAKIEVDGALKLDTVSPMDTPSLSLDQPDAESSSMRGLRAAIQR